MEKVKEIASKSVDEMVEAGLLDCGAIIYKKIEKIIEDVLEKRTKEVAEFVEGCYKFSDEKKREYKKVYSKAYDKKSVKWKWFDDHAYIVEKLKAPLRWNLQKLYEQVI